MKLLVVTPTRATSSWLHETVASVAALTVPTRHVLVAPEQCRAQLLKKSPRVEIVSENGSGIYAALNRALAFTGEWDAFTWINDDDRLCPKGLSSAWARFVATPMAQVIYGRVNYVDSSGRSLGPFPVERQPERLKSLFAAGLPGLTQHGTLVRRSLVERLKGFDMRYRLAADFDFWARALAAEANFRYIDEHLADYRLRGGQLSADISAVTREIADSAARILPSNRAHSKRWTRSAFRIRHLPDLLKRFLRTGCLRTDTLYRRAGGQSP